MKTKLVLILSIFSDLTLTSPATKKTEQDVCTCTIRIPLSDLKGSPQTSSSSARYPFFQGCWPCPPSRVGRWCRSALCWRRVRSAPSVLTCGHQPSHLALGCWWWFPDLRCFQMFKCYFNLKTQWTPSKVPLYIKLIFCISGLVHILFNSYGFLRMVLYSKFVSFSQYS